MHIRFALWASLLTLCLLPPSYAGRAELARIAVSGCEQINQGGICELKNAHEIVLWHEGFEQLQAYLPDAHAWTSYAGERVGSGSLFRVPVRAEQGRLRLRFGASTQQLLQLRAAASWPWQKQIEAADNVAARELLSGLLSATLSR